MARDFLEIRVRSAIAVVQWPVGVEEKWEMKRERED